MFQGLIDVDYVGFALFDPARLERHHGGIPAGTDLWARYTKTDEGDAVIAAGLIVPVLGLTTGGYELIVRRSDDAPVPALPPLVFENGVYPLQVDEGLVVAGCETFLDWGGEHAEHGWQRLDLAPGRYGVTVRGFRAIDAAARSIERAGYELVLEPCDVLPAMTARMEMSMQVLRFPDD